MLQAKPFPALNLLRVQGERPFGMTTINPDMFHTGFRRRGKFEQPARWSRRDQPKFLLQFAQGARIIVLAAIEMARGRRIPGAGEAILLHRTLLQKNLAARIEHQHVHRTVLQSKAVDLWPRVASDDLVTIIYHIEDFFAHVVANIWANLMKVGKSTCSARMFSGSPTPAKASCKRSRGQSAFSSLNIILRR